MAAGNWSVSRACCTRRSRRESFVVIVLRSASIAAAVRVVPSIVMVPVTSPVRPTAVVDPMLASSSSTRNPTNDPVADSKSNVPIDVSTAQVPSTLPPVGGAVVPAAVVEAEPVVSGAAVVVACSAASTAPSRLTSSGASSRKNQASPAATPGCSVRPRERLRLKVRLVILGPKTISFGWDAFKKSAAAARASSTSSSDSRLVANAPPWLALCSVR